MRQVLLLVILAALPLRAVAGAHLDAAFGTGGIFEMAWPAGSASANAVGIDTSGRIVVGGSADAADGHSTFAFFRLLPDGTLDTHFAADAGGVRLVDFNLDPNGYDRLNDMIVEPDGTILAVGAAHWGQGGFHSQFALTRLAADGRLDPGFGNGGLVHFDAGSPPFQDSAWSVAIDGKGRIVMLGQAARHRPASEDFNYWLALARLTPHGDLDAGFADGGLAETRFWPGAIASNGPRGNSYDLPVAIALDARRRLLVGGGFTYGGGGSALLRMLADGAADDTFGDDGRVRMDADFGVGSLRPLPDGGLMVSGARRIDASRTGLFLARLDKDGHLDPRFGEDGIATVVPPYGSPGYVAIEPTGNGGWTLACGLAIDLADVPPGLGTMVARFDAAGRPDPSLGDQGFALVDAVDGRHFSAIRSAFQTDGKVVFAGSFSDGPEVRPHFAVMRIVIDGDTVFADGFDG